MISIINVVKRDGEKEPLNLDKFHKVVEHACEGITGVSVSQIELSSQIQFYNNIKTSDIQETLINSAAKLISDETPNYQYVAGRLINYHLRKEVYGDFKPPHLFDHVTKLVKKRLYDKELLKMYDIDEWDKLDKIIKHGRDDLLTYAAMEQFRGKYLVKNRATGQIFETPQMVYLLVAAVLFHKYPKETRLDWVRRYYDAISQHHISLPTPVLSGVRTTERQFSSCVVVECADSLNSICTTSTVIKKYISARAGLGILGGFIRAEGDEVKGGSKRHTGIRPYWRSMQSDVRSCSQGGVRNGAGTMNYHFFHKEFPDLIVLKNNRGTHETRLTHMDYCVHVNRLFYQRYLEGGNISFFSPKDTEELVAAFYRNDPDFEQMYIAAENSRIPRITLPAKEVMEDMLAKERVDTGRIYIMNIDHANDHSSFTIPIKGTNLCVEITLPTHPLEHEFDEEGEIALCTLSAINWGKASSDPEACDEWMREMCQLAVRALNELLDYQDYPFAAARNATMKRRPLGVGIVNLAYWIAKNDMTYTNADLNKIDEMVERQMFYLLETSADLAEERGPCPGWNETKYSKGILPLDTYKSFMDTLISRKPTKDWEGLRIRFTTVGGFNSTVAAGMPGETSSQVVNATSGVDPIRALVSYKKSKDGVLAQVVPEHRNLGSKYEVIWEMKSPRGYLEVCATIQKWFDQSISTNTSYNPLNYDEKDEEGNPRIPLSVIVGDILYAYKLGLKTLYYNNVLDNSGEDENEVELQDEQPAEEEICEACTI
jgi:ribonucleoside-diphosphate reductase alpha chain